jgi:CubicO group peptidase (beta-lactamase class C family)
VAAPARRLAVLAASIGAALVAAAPGSGPVAAAPLAGRAGGGEFAPVDAAMRARLRGQTGGAVLIGPDDTTLHRRTFGRFRPSTRFRVASASKWLTAATLLSLVDDGHLALDDPVARFLPEFGGDKASVTVRTLLAHTSGLTDPGCVGDPTTSLTDCTRRIASSPMQNPPGVAFRYSEVGYEVVARVIEVEAGATFERAFEDRIGTPTGMSATKFEQVSGPHDANPDPASAAVSTLDDWQRYLEMVLHLGVAGGRRVLSASSVLDIERDQVAGLDTRSDAAVQITRIPTYGLGVWRDVVDATDQAVIVSGNGGLGFYPWVDRAHDTYGVVAVDDDRSSEVAVPASQRVARLEWTTAARAP